MQPYHPDHRPALIVHGGTWNIPDHAVAECRAGCHAALTEGWRVLNEGGSAVASVEAAIRVLEDDPTFDAGRGSHLNRAGAIELDAIIMDGTTLNAGAVAAVRDRQPHSARPTPARKWRAHDARRRRRAAVRARAGVRTV